MSNQKRHLSVVPNSGPSFIDRLARHPWRVAAAVGASALTIVGVPKLTEGNPRRVTPQVGVCIPSQETHTYTFKDGEGADAAVLSIPGAGEGKGDLCWPDAKKIVEDQLKEQSQYHNPTAQKGEVIRLPNHIDPHP